MKRYFSIFLLALAVIGCSDKHSKIRGEFLAGCIDGGTSKAICKCTFEKLENHYGDQLENTGPSQVSPFIAQSLLECRNGQSSLKPSQSVAGDTLKAGIIQALAPPNSNTINGGGTDARTANDNTARQALERAITEQVNLRTKYGGGTEYPDGRKIIETDVNRDGSPDAVVLYTIEGADGGNAAVQTLQLFFGNQGSYFAQGSETVGGVADITLGGDGSILVHSLTHGPDDSDCCPTIKSSQRYRIEGNQLLQAP